MAVNFDPYGSGKYTGPNAAAVQADADRMYQEAVKKHGKSYLSKSSAKALAVHKANSRQQNRENLAHSKKVLEQKAAKRQASGLGGKIVKIAGGLVAAGFAAPLVGSAMGAGSFTPGLGASTAAKTAAMGSGTGFSTIGGMSMPGTFGAQSVAAGAAAPSGGILSSLGSVGKVISAIGESPIYKGLSAANKVVSAINNASSLFGGSPKPQKQSLREQKIAPAEAPAFSPVRPGAMARPGSLNEFSSFAPDQERSALATKGLNSGLGGEENDYYKNLIQRSLIGDGNQVQQKDDFLMPIESQYFSQQGLNTSDLMQFLQGISG